MKRRHPLPFLHAFSLELIKDWRVCSLVIWAQIVIIVKYHEVRSLYPLPIFAKCASRFDIFILLSIHKRIWFDLIFFTEVSRMDFKLILWWLLLVQQSFSDHLILLPLGVYKWHISRLFNLLCQLYVMVTIQPAITQYIILIWGIITF